MTIPLGRGPAPATPSKSPMNRQAQWLSGAVSMASRPRGLPDIMVVDAGHSVVARCRTKPRQGPQPRAEYLDSLETVWSIMRNGRVDRGVVVTWCSGVKRRYESV